MFTVPPQAVLQARNHAEATALCRELCGFGVSQQAFALGPKILDVDTWTRQTDLHVVEVHPEVSFATLAGRHLLEPKSTWTGFMLRLRLLADAGISLDDGLGLSGRRVAPDDVLDAAVAAWTANRVDRSIHITLPNPPEHLADGREVAIWA